MGKKPLLKDVLFVLPAIAREGITKQVSSQIKALQDKGISVNIIILSSVSEEVMIDLGINLSNQNMLVLNQSTAYLSVEALVRSIKIVRPIIHFMKEKGSKVTIAHAPYAHFVMRLVKLLAPLYNVHFCLFQYFHINQYAEFPLVTFRRKALNILNRILANVCDNGHISVSFAVKEDIEQHLIQHKNHQVIYNTLAESPGNITLKRNEGYNNVQMTSDKPELYKILLPGRLEHHKGHLFFLEVFKLFMKQNEARDKNIEVTIVGDGSQRPRLTAFIMQHGLEERVIMHESCSGIRLKQMMDAADLVVVPSFFEGLPMVILEALHLDKVVLASDAGGIGEVIEDGVTGFKFEKGNKAQCLDKLNFIYQHRSEDDLIDKNAIHNLFRLKFSAAVNTDLLLSTLQSCKNL